MPKRDRKPSTGELRSHKKRSGATTDDFCEFPDDAIEQSALPQRLELLSVKESNSEDERSEMQMGLALLNRPNAKWRQLPIKINFLPIVHPSAVSLVRRLVEEEYFVCLDLAKEEESKRVAERKRQIQMTGRGKKPASRSTDKALRIMYDKGLVCNQSRIFGHVPGVQNGDKFKYKTQMKAVGLHRNVMAGIDYLGQNVLTKSSPSLAISICVAGCYEDDNDNGTEMLYTGQGGNDLMGRQVQVADQCLKRGNLALRNNAIYGVPVRVIKKNVDQFVYDGLWDVLQMIKTRGKEDKIVYQYRMQRCPGQEKSSARKVNFREGYSHHQSSAGTLPSDTEIFEDFSRGLNRTPVSVINGIDEELPCGLNLSDLSLNVQNVKKWKEASENFEFGIDMRLSHGVEEICSERKVPQQYGRDPHGYLKELNHDLIPYKLDGRVKHALCILYECGPWVKCPDGENCGQRITNRQPRWRFQLFRTKSKGWGVKTLDLIPVGCFVMKYIGEVMPVEKVSSDDAYSFNLSKRPDYTDENEYTDRPLAVDVKYVVTGRHYGNLFRFINHSCDPNCFIQPVLSAHLDKTRPDICVFAMRRIFPGEEVSYDYGRDYVDDLLQDGCMCGSACCVQRVIEA